MEKRPKTERYNYHRQQDSEQLSKSYIAVIPQDSYAQESNDENNNHYNRDMAETRKDHDNNNSSESNKFIQTIPNNKNPPRKQKQKQKSVWSRISFKTMSLINNKPPNDDHKNKYSYNFVDQEALINKIYSKNNNYENVFNNKTKNLKYIYLKQVCRKFIKNLKEVIPGFFKSEQIQKKYFEMIDDKSSNYRSYKLDFIHKTTQKGFINQWMFQLKYWLINIITMYLPLKQNIFLVKFFKILNILIVLVALFYTTSAVCFRWQLDNDFKIVVIVNQVVTIVLNFITNFYRNGLPIGGSREIAIRYLKGFFFIDVVIFFQALLQYDDNNLDVIIIKSYFIIIPWILKIIKVLDDYDSLTNRYRHSAKLRFIFDLIKLLFILVSQCHLSAIGLIIVGEVTSDSHEMGNVITVSHSIKYDQNSWIDIYLICMYWSIVTLTTVGYGDITPVNVVEMIYMMLSIVIGTTTFAYFISKISSMINDYNNEDNIIRRQIDIINQYFIKNSISEDIQDQVRQYISHLIKEVKIKNIEEEDQIISQLNTPLQNELRYQSYSKVLQKCHVFQNNFSQQLIKELSINLEQQRYTPSQIIYKSGSHDDFNVYFISHGMVQSIWQSENKNNSKNVRSFYNLAAQDYFGIKEFFTEMPKTQTMQSQSYTTVFYISRQKFISILEQYPNDLEVFNQIKDQYLQDPKYEVLKDHKCQICQSIYHKPNECNKVSFTVNKELLLKKHTYQIPQIRSQFQRKVKKTDINKNARMVYSNFNISLEQSRNREYNINFDHQEGRWLDNQQTKDYINQQIKDYTSSNTTSNIDETQNKPNSQQPKLNKLRKLIKKSANILKQQKLNKIKPKTSNNDYETQIGINQTLNSFSQNHQNPNDKQIQNFISQNKKQSHDDLVQPTQNSNINGQTYKCNDQYCVYEPNLVVQQNQNQVADQQQLYQSRTNESLTMENIQSYNKYFKHFNVDDLIQ